MDFTADKVVVELEARLAQYNNDINGSAANVESAMGRTTRAATEAETAMRSAFSSIAQQSAGSGKALEQFTVSDLRAAQAVGELIVALQREAETMRMITPAELAAANAIGNFARAFGSSATQVVGHSNRMGVSQQIMMHVVRGSTDQFAAGAPVMQIFTQHLGMIAEAAALSQGSLGALGTFMSTGWGFAVSAAIAILATLIGNHHAAAGAAKDHTKAEQDLTEAVKELHKAMQTINDSEGDTIQHHIDAARAVLNRAMAERELTKALLEQAIAADARNNAEDPRFQPEGYTGPIDETPAQQRERIQGEVKAGRLPKADADRFLAAAGRSFALQQLLKTINDEIIGAQQSFGETQIELARHIAEGQTDAMKKENASFEADRRLLENQFRPAIRAAAATVAELNATRPGSAAAKKAAEELAAATKRLTDAEAKLISGHLTRTRQIQDEQSADRNAGATSFRLPVNGPVTGSFGDNRGARPGVRRHEHAGVDIAVPVGTNVGAAAGGTVIEVGTLPGYGNVVIIDHGGGTTTRYAHLSKFLVSKGEQVTQGQVIALSGGARGAPGSGDATGPHVHYEVRQGGRPVNPLTGRYATDPYAAQTAAERLARKAEEERNQRIARDQAFGDTMAQLDTAIIAAKRKQVTSAADNERLEEEGIETERKKRETDYADLAARGKLTKEQARLLTVKSNELAAAQTATIEQQKQARLEKETTVKAEQTLRVRTSEIGNQREILQGADGLAKTQAERRRIEMLLLDLQFEEMRLREQAIIDQAERVKASKTSTEAEKQQAETDEQIARARLQALGILKAQEKVGVERRTAGPIEAFRESITKTKEQVNEDLQQIAVDGITQLTDGLADAITGARSLGDVFHTVSRQIIADLIRIAIQQLIVKNLMDMFGGGGGGIFGSGGGLNKSASSFGSGSLKGFAGGGRPPVGRPSIIGEDGPEVWVPDQAGTIYPMNNMAAMPGANGGGALIRIMVESGEFFEAKVTHISGNVAVETVRVAAPHLTEAAVSETGRRLGRPGM